MAERYGLHNGIIRNFAPPNGNIFAQNKLGIKDKSIIFACGYYEPTINKRLIKDYPTINPYRKRIYHLYTIELWI